MPCAAPVMTTTLPEKRLLVAFRCLLVLAGAGDRIACAAGRVGADFGPVVDRILRPLDRWDWMILQFLHRDRDTLLELWVLTLAPKRGREFHFDVRCDAFVLDVEFARVGIVAAPARSCDAATIHQVRIAADANQSTPGAGA